MKKPSTTEPNGRDKHGRFIAGNRIAIGNPHAKRVAQLRSSLLKSVSRDDVKEIVRKLVSLAKEGDTVAARILFDRILGRPIESDLLARIEDLEEQLGGKA
jgi:ribosomal protein L17